MEKENDVFNLIKSLSKSEKRYFKLNNANANSSHIKLFNLLSKQNHSDEARLKEELKNENFANHLPIIKNTLVTSILKNLRSYHSQKTVDFYLYEQLMDANLLFDKGFYKRSKKILLNIKKESYTYERFSIVLEIIKREKQLFYLLIEDPNYKKITDLMKEEAEVIAIIDNLYQYQNLSSMLFLSFMKKGITRNTEETTSEKFFKNNVLLKDIKSAKSVLAKDYYYSIYSIFSFQDNNYKKAVSISNKRIKLWENHTVLTDESPERYILTLKNLISLYIRLNEKENAFKALLKLKLITEKKLKNHYSMHNQTYYLLGLYSMELELYKKFVDLDKAKKLLIKIEPQLSSLNKKINKMDELFFYFNITIIYMYMGNFEKASKWINLIIQFISKKTREDIIGLSRLLYLIIQYERNELILIESNIKATVRYLLNTKKLYDFEKTIVTFFNEITSQVYTDKNLKDKFFNLKTKLNTIQQDPFHAKIKNYFDFDAYLESKIKGEPIAEILQKKIIKKK